MVYISSKNGQFSNPQKKEKPHSSLTDGRSICNARPKSRVCRNLLSPRCSKYTGQHRGRPGPGS